MIDEAEDFLRSELAAGPKLAKAVQAAARDLGISHITLKRAKKALGIEAGKDGYQGPWKWYLDPEQQRGSTGLDPLSGTEVDPLCKTPVDAGDSGSDPIKGDQADTAEPLCPQSADLGTSKPYAGRNDDGDEMPF